MSKVPVCCLTFRQETFLWSDDENDRTRRRVKAPTLMIPFSTFSWEQNLRLLGDFCWNVDTRACQSGRKAWLFFQNLTIYYYDNLHNFLPKIRFKSLATIHSRKITFKRLKILPKWPTFVQSGHPGDCHYLGHGGYEWKEVREQYYKTNYVNKVRRLWYLACYFLLANFFSSVRIYNSDPLMQWLEIIIARLDHHGEYRRSNWHAYTLSPPHLP